MTHSTSQAASVSTLQRAAFVGTTTMKSTGTATSDTTSSNQKTEIREDPIEDDEGIPRDAARGNESHAAPAGGNKQIVADATVPGFNGLSHADQRLADNGNQFSLEPPDQALCVGNGYVLESINTALRVYHTDGTPATGTIAINPFFGLSSEIIRSTLTFGDFTSDPKCYYDAATQRWFVSILQADVAPSTGDFTGQTSVMLAVSTSNDPTGSWNIFKIDTTDGDGSLPGHPDCPCLGDQPLIGADANGFYVTTNEFPLFADGFNGAQVYAMSKSALESGSSLNVVHINAGAMPTPDTGGIWYSIQPATVPAGGSYESAAGGTEYFLSALQFSSDNPFDNRIAAWALTNTSSLGNASPSVSLSHVIVNSEVYGQPPNAQQKSGSRPLAEKNLFAAIGFQAPTPPLALLAGNDDRMNQVVFADGKLWSGVNTATATDGVVAIAYFIVTPSMSGSTLSAAMTNQGYIANGRNSVLYPSIGVTPAGNGVVTFTVAGKDYYPSAGYATIDATNGAGDVHIASAGVLPEDGFTGYPVIAGGDGVSRWGDYSAAVADENGNVWFATEYIPGGPRTILANWGTFVGHLHP
ncbi:MAG TPA: hypothetical protein VFY89_01080 [Ktedonobacterales bacterium]